MTVTISTEWQPCFFSLPLFYATVGTAQQNFAKDIVIVTAHCLPLLHAFYGLGKDSSLHMRDDMRGQLKEASCVTSQAFSAYRKELDPEMEGLGQNSEVVEEVEEIQMSASIAIMKPILRYLQLLCENHNSELQVFFLLYLHLKIIFQTDIFCLKNAASRTFSGTKTTRPITTWSVRRCSSWTVSVVAPQEAWGCWDST